MLISSVKRRRNRQKEIIDHLKGRLRSGDLRSGDRLPTYAELMDSFSVTSNVVSRALLHLEHEGLLSREQGRGVFVSQAPAKTRLTIGLMVPEEGPLRTSYWQRLIDGASAEAIRRCADLLLLSVLTEGGVSKADGVIFFSQKPSGMAGVLRATPSIEVFSAGPHSLRFDDADGGYSAARHLLQLGHKRIGWLAQTRSAVGIARIGGYLTALWEAGVPVDPLLFHDVCFGSSDWVGMGKSGIHELMKSAGAAACTAVIAQNDLIAIGAMQGLTEMGLSVPGDMSVVGFDGSQEGALVSPPITSMDIPLEEIGTHAVRMLIEKIDGSAADDSTYFYVWPLTLKLAGSTAPPREIG